MKLLLDEHFPDDIADAIRRELPEVEITSVHARELDGLPDPVLLEILDEEKTVLVSRDVNSLPDHAARRIGSGQTHGGLILVGKSIRQTDSRELIRRLVALIREKGRLDWRCRQDWL